MQLRFHKDPDTGLPHIYGHGVTEDEVRQVLANPGDDRPSADESRTVLGKTNAGRHLRVIVVPDKIGDGIFVVTAFDLLARIFHRPVILGQ